jgi:hypothetical protein
MGNVKVAEEPAIFCEALSLSTVVHKIAVWYGIAAPPKK